MSWNNGQWVRLQQSNDFELLAASVMIERCLMEAAENFLLHRDGLVGTLIEGMETPAQLNKYRQERDLLVNTGKVDERCLRMEAINLLIRR